MKNLASLWYARALALVNHLSITMLHAYLLGCAGIAYIALAAPLALETVILVAVKTWAGAIIGFWLDKAVFGFAAPVAEQAYAPWMNRRAGLMIGGMFAMALGV